MEQSLNHKSALKNTATPKVPNIEEIPQCRDDFNLEEACEFIDQIAIKLRDLSDLSNLTDLYRAGRQLNRTFAMCENHRTELAAYICDREIPRLITRIIKRLNYLGVFSNDGTWFSSFYMYSTLWNYTDIDPTFSTSVGTTGIAELFMLNIGHPPYLTNINSKNVYFIVKASLSILHNVIKIPGNRDMGRYRMGCSALLRLLKIEGEDTLHCLAVLCLAHLLNEDEINLADLGHSNLLQYLLSHISSACGSVKRKHHGFPLLDFLTALNVFAVNEPVQPGILSMDVEKLKKSNKPQTDEMQPANCLKFLTRLVDAYLSPESTEETLKEANAAIRIIYHLQFNHELAQKTKVKNCTKHMLDLSRYPAILERPNKALVRALENVIWQASQQPCPQVMKAYPLPEPSYCGPIVMSYSPINNLPVAYFVTQLRAAGLPIWNDMEEPMLIDHVSAQEVGLSGLAAAVNDQKSWLQCLQQSTVMIVCLSDAYRLNPGCRSELEYFISSNSEAEPKVAIFIRLPPKFTINGWIGRIPGIDQVIDFTHKRTFINNLQVLVSRAGNPYGITVADEQLEPLSFDLGDPKGYISLEDLNALKSSSIFLTSSDSEASVHSMVDQTADQMPLKGASRELESQKNTSESATSSPNRAKVSYFHKPTEFIDVAPILQEKSSDAYPDEQLQGELVRGSTPASPKAVDEEPEELADKNMDTHATTASSKAFDISSTEGKRTSDQPVIAMTPEQIGDETVTGTQGRPGLETSMKERSIVEETTTHKTVSTTQKVIHGSRTSPTFASRDTETHLSARSVGVVRTTTDPRSSKQETMQEIMQLEDMEKMTNLTGGTITEYGQESVRSNQEWKKDRGEDGKSKGMEISDAEASQNKLSTKVQVATESFLVLDSQSRGEPNEKTAIQQSQISTLVSDLQKELESQNTDSRATKASRNGVTLSGLQSPQNALTSQQEVMENSKKEGRMVEPTLTPEMINGKSTKDSKVEPTPIQQDIVSQKSRSEAGELVRKEKSAVEYTPPKPASISEKSRKEDPRIETTSQREIGSEESRRVDSRAGSTPSRGGESEVGVRLSDQGTVSEKSRRSELGTMDADYMVGSAPAENDTVDEGSKPEESREKPPPSRREGIDDESKKDSLMGGRSVRTEDRVLALEDLDVPLKVIAITSDRSSTQKGSIVQEASIKSSKVMLESLVARNEETCSRKGESIMTSVTTCQVHTNGRSTHLHMKRITNQSLKDDSIGAKSHTLSSKPIPEAVDKQSGSLDLSHTVGSYEDKASMNKEWQRVVELQNASAQTETSGKPESYIDSNRISQSIKFPDAPSPIMRMADQNEIVEAFVRDWNEQEVDRWLNSKGLPQLSNRFCGRLNGVVLSQLVYLRHWAPEYFAKSIRSELGLGFVEALQLVEAMEELKKKH